MVQHFNFLEKMNIHLRTEPQKEHLLLVVLACFFACNAVAAEFVGSKLFSLEKTFGFALLDCRSGGKPTWRPAS